jgi:hypothetical protein
MPHRECNVSWNESHDRRVAILAFTRLCCPPELLQLGSHFITKIPCLTSRVPMLSGGGGGIVYLYLLALFLVFIPGLANAQGAPPCSLPVYDHPEIPWSDGGCQWLTLGTDCVVWVCWCERTVNGKYEFYIRSIENPAGWPCENFNNWHDLVLRADEILTRGRATPCIQGEQTVIEETTAQCWFSQTKYDQNGMPYQVIGPCQETGYCRKEVRICHDDFGYQRYVLSTTFVQGGSCQLEQPGQVHENGVCYDIDPCRPE